MTCLLRFKGGASRDVKIDFKPKVDLCGHRGIDLDLRSQARQPHAMASLLRAFSLSAQALGHGRAVLRPWTATTSWAPSSVAGPGATAWLQAATAGTIGGGLMQQTRGMKVHSSVKKRCEHCKVGLHLHDTSSRGGGASASHGRSRARREDKLTDSTSQVVRRKAGKRHNGYLYIICKANPRHKQRQS